MREATTCLAAAAAAFDRLSRETGMKAADEAFGADGLRFYRNGARPPLDKQASLAAPGIGLERLAWTVEHAELARSSDLGYTRGRYCPAAQGAVLGYYLRVWRREGAAWRVVLDVANPAITPPATN